MNTATTTTVTLNEGYFSRRNWLDWLFAAIVIVGGLFALQRYAAYMDGYEKGILLGAIPVMVWLGWFWRPLRILMLVVAALALMAIGLYQQDGVGSLERAEAVLRGEQGQRFTQWIGSGLLIAGLTGAGAFAQVHRGGVVAPAVPASHACVLLRFL